MRAFTLIELLVVVSIIAILAAMLLPTIRLVRESAYTTVCVANMRQLGMAVQAYSDDNQGLMAMTATYGLAVADDFYGPDFTYYHWYAPLRSYLDAPETNQATKVFICPRSKLPNQIQHGFGLSYAVNNARYAGGAFVFPPSRAGFPLAKLRNRSATVLLAEKWGLTATGYDWNGNVAPPYYPGVPPRSDDGNVGAPHYSLRVRHKGSSNYLFGDLHTETLTPWARVDKANTDAAPTVPPNIWTGLP
ncbi:MAG: type II secretion system protein [Planctomycetes bacterium]|nr:type II secretion system protein [Planctomycetota bacterium]